MARIGIDASILLHGMRAGKRHTNNLLSVLLTNYTDDDWRLLYFDRKGNTPGRLSSTLNKNIEEVVSRIPIRILLKLWNTIRCPSVENWIKSIDILYAPDMYFPPSKNAPVLCTIHGVAYMVIPQLLEPKAVSGLITAFEYARKHAHHFMAVSESTRDDLVRLTDIPSNRIHVVTLGVDPGFRQLDSFTLYDSIKNKYGIERDFILYVGVIGKHKNVMGILQAYHLSKLCRQGVDLVLAGPIEPEIHPARSFIERYELEEHVHFTGLVGQEDDSLVELYNAALCLVHPTFYEGWGTTPLEAMACGTPVVTSDIKPVREVVQDAALLVPPDDPEALKGAILQIAGDGKCRSVLIERGLKHAAQHTWESAAKRFRQVISDVQKEGK